MRFGSGCRPAVACAVAAATCTVLVWTRQPVTDSIVPAAMPSPCTSTLRVTPRAAGALEVVNGALGAHGLQVLARVTLVVSATALDHRMGRRTVTARAAWGGSVPVHRLSSRCSGGGQGRW